MLNFEGKSSRGTVWFVLIFYTYRAEYFFSQRKEGILMAKKKAVRRENGRGTVEKTSNKKNERYFASLNSESSKRTVTSAYAYCSGLYDMPKISIHLMECDI